MAAHDASWAPAGRSSRRGRSRSARRRRAARPAPGRARRGRRCRRRSEGVGDRVVLDDHLRVRAAGSRRCRSGGRRRRASPRGAWAGRESAWPTTRGGATARASDSTARAWPRAAAALRPPPGQLDHERVSPPNSLFCQEVAVPCVGGQAPARQAAAPRVEPLERRVAGAAARPCVSAWWYQTRHARTLALDEALHRPGLGLRRRARARLVHAVLRAPAIGEVAVEVDPGRVVAIARGARRPGWRRPPATARCRVAGGNGAAGRSRPCRPARCRGSRPPPSPSSGRVGCPRAGRGSDGPARAADHLPRRPGRDAARWARGPRRGS